MLQCQALLEGEGSSALSRQDARCCFAESYQGCGPSRGGGSLGVGRRPMCCGSKVVLRHGEHANPSIVGARVVVQRDVGRHGF